MGAQLKIRVRYRTDWFQVLTDLQRAGLENQRIARVLDVPWATIRGWKCGSEPNHHDGHRLLELWMGITGKGITQRPMQHG